LGIEGPRALFTGGLTSGACFGAARKPHCFFEEKVNPALFDIRGSGTKVELIGCR
jgi:hypothetical protein